ncbi:MAG: DUF5063 domain-containing protein [candidate division Zixibacteria bacterium]|nr:DUF5063 domain-containing protein [candidate division Zixibacteria bacterium]
MIRIDIKTTIKKFLQLVTELSGSVQKRENDLRLLLDELAIATHQTKPSESLTDLETPDYDYNKLRHVIGKCFPNYGLYLDADTDPGREPGVGDAIDDITDMALALSEVLWLWDHASETDAMWQFHFSFETHWGSHLRGLQWYAHEIEREN